MYNPCIECQNKYNRQRSEWCNENCAYAHEIAKLKPYGGVDEAVKCMKGEAIPVRLFSSENREFALQIFRAVEAGVI